jgi:hypothetical protein
MHWWGPAEIENNKQVLSSKGCYIRAMTAGVRLKKNSGCESQGARLQDKLIGGKPPVMK